MPELVRKDLPKDGKQEGHSRARCIQGFRGCWHRLPRHGTALKQSHAKSTPPSPGGTGEGTRGLQATSYSLRAGNSASFYQIPHQSFYISLPSAGSAQTLHPLPGSRTPCASCSAPVTCGGTRGCRGRERGTRCRGSRTEEKQNRKEHIMKVFQPWEVLTPYLLNRISRSSLPLRYLSSIKGLWSMESSPSGSGLSQPLKPFFLNV